MSLLRIHLLGRLEVHRDDVLLPHFPTRIAASLFGALVLSRGRTLSRDVLLGFWRDESEGVARKGLRNALWRVRSTLEQADAAHLLETDGDGVGFAATGYWLDVAEFERSVAAAQLAQAVALYRGDLLDGIYDDWCLFDRERLRLAYLTALERLMRQHAAADELHEAVSCGRTLLHHDPLREQVHRDLMLYHYALGNRPAALVQYRECAAFLERELGIEPMVETQELRDRVLSGAAAHGAGAAPRLEPAPASGSTSPAMPRSMEDERPLRRVLADLTYAAERLEEARQTLSRDLGVADGAAHGDDAQGKRGGSAQRDAARRGADESGRQSSRDVRVT